MGLNRTEGSHWDLIRNELEPNISDGTVTGIVLGLLEHGIRKYLVNNFG